MRKLYRIKKVEKHYCKELKYKHRLSFPIKEGLPLRHYFIPMRLLQNSILPPHLCPGSPTRVDGKSPLERGAVVRTPPLMGGVGEVGEHLILLQEPPSENFTV